MYNFKRNIDFIDNQIFITICFQLITQKYNLKSQFLNPNPISGSSDHRAILQQNSLFRPCPTLHVRGAMLERLLHPALVRLTCGPRTTLDHTLLCGAHVHGLWHIFVIFLPYQS